MGAMSNHGELGFRPCSYKQREHRGREGKRGGVRVLGAFFTGSASRGGILAFGRRGGTGRRRWRSWHLEIETRSLLHISPSVFP